MNKLFSLIVLIGLPLSFIGGFFHFSTTIMFGIYCITIVGISAYMGRATESLSILSGPRIGGLLNATFGNAVELIIAIFSLKAGLVGIVLASLTGSVIGNLLLVGGLSFFVGGLKYKRQNFNVHDAKHNATQLVFAVVLAFVIPEIFSQDMDYDKTYTLSVGISIILILLYLSALFFKLVTHRGVYVHKYDEQNDHIYEEAEWSKKKSLVILAMCTIAVSFVSEKLVHTFEEVGERFGWSELFIGIIIVAIVGNAAEHTSAIVMAYKNKINVAVEIAVGSTIQVAMFVTPLLVILSILFPPKMALLFTIPELVSMVTAVILTIVLTNDGDTNWFEGLTLLSAYLIMAIGFFLL